MPALSHTSGEVISYIEMCQAWSASLQKGMNYHLRPNCSVILMSRRSNAPYRDRIEENGRVLIYEGHDVSRHDGETRTRHPRGSPHFSPASFSDCNKTKAARSKVALGQSVPLPPSLPSHPLLPPSAKILPSPM